MKRKIILSIILILIILIGGILIYPKKENKILNTTINNKSDLISIMVEKEAGTGNYEKATNYPNSGYYLNKKLSKCINGNKISFSEGNLLVKGSKSDRCYAYFDKDELGSICKGQNLSECFTKNYKKDSSIIYHDGLADYEAEENVELEAGDLSYRYTGSTKEVNNFVCFASNEEKCPYHNLYRIIGFFKNEDGKYEAKLIKYDYTTAELTGKDGDYANDYYYHSDIQGDINQIGLIMAYYWNGPVEHGGTANDVWQESRLNKVNLNTNYYNYLGSWQKYVQNHNWIVRGSDIESYSANAKMIYTYEHTNSQYYQAKIGLIYPSDFMYAADSQYWSYPAFINDESNDDFVATKNHDWMFMGMTEWTIFPDNKVNYAAMVVGSTHKLWINYVDVFTMAIRPSFYLVRDVKLKEGNGTYENPYRLSVEL